MARVVTNKQASIDISESYRQTQSNFSEQNPNAYVGPEPVQNTPGETVSNTKPAVSQINKWKAMTTADEGLKNALYDWINTTKDGVRVSPDITSGRTKKLTFNFYGNIGKSIKPGEIGEFNIVFSYPQNTIQYSSKVLTK
jgi:hypothetical protein